MSVESRCQLCNLFSLPCGPKIPLQILPISSETHSTGVSVPSTPTYGGSDSVDPLDSCYFSYFLSSMPHILNYIVVFPTLFSDILCRGIQDASVRHSVLSIASFLADHRLNRSMGRFDLNYITSLQVIQRSIAEVRVDESLAIAVFLIAWIDAARGQYEVCRKHLRGLSLILERVQPICQNPTASRDRISPLIMLIWRFAIRMDCSVSFFAFQQPIFPMMPPAEDLHREWISQVSASNDGLEWALAAFALDNLFHRTCHYAVRVHQLRGGNRDSLQKSNGMSLQSWKDFKTKWLHGTTVLSLKLRDVSKTKYNKTRTLHLLSSSITPNSAFAIRSTQISS